MDFYWPVPKSLSRSQKNMALSGFMIPTKKDGDNCFKFYADCCQGILWPDDRLIRSGSYFKNYSTQPRTEIHWNEINLEKAYSFGQKFESLKQIHTTLLNELAETSPSSTLPPVLLNNP